MNFGRTWCPNMWDHAVHFWSKFCSASVWSLWWRSHIIQAGRSQDKVLHTVLLAKSPSGEKEFLLGKMIKCSWGKSKNLQWDYDPIKIPTWNGNPHEDFRIPPKIFRILANMQNPRRGSESPPDGQNPPPVTKSPNTDAHSLRDHSITHKVTWLYEQKIYQ